MGLSERQTLMPKQLGLLGKVLRIPCARAAAKRSSAPPFASTALAAQQQHRWAPGAAALISWFRRRHFEDVHRAERLRVWCGYSARLYDSGGGVSTSQSLAHTSTARKDIGRFEPCPGLLQQLGAVAYVRGLALSQQGVCARYISARRWAARAPTSGAGQRRCLAQQTFC